VDCRRAAGAIGRFYTAALASVSVLEAILGSVNVPMVAVAVILASERRPARGGGWASMVMLTQTWCSSRVGTPTLRPGESRLRQFTAWVLSVFCFF